MTENRNYDPTFGEVAYGSVVGAGKIAGDFLRGAIVLPLACLGIPTYVRTFKNIIKDAEEKGERISRIRCGALNRTSGIG